MLALSSSEFDGDAVTYSWDFGDGTTGSGPTPPSTHTYADDGLYTLTLTATDKDGSNTKTTTATVLNVAPSIASGGLSGPVAAIQLVSGAASAPISLTFADPAGAHDTYTATVQCGNGVSIAAAVNAGAANTITCPYTATGIYTVQATVADEDGGVSPQAQFQYVVVYDPTGAFATGSGWFISGPRDCPVLCGGATGKAHFAFTAKFQPGQTTMPTGSAKLWLDSKQLEFRSTSLTMLVVSGNLVQFWGAGTLNGFVGYSFRITASSSQGSQGAFRMEIWDSSQNLLYDNQWSAPRDAPLTTLISAGQISIHP